MTWDISKIRNLLETNNNAVGRALMVLNARQTFDEQQSKDTRYRNGRGFKPCHARCGTSMAEFYQNRGFLTTKQIVYWRAKDRRGTSRIGCYAGQLLEEIKLKQA